MAKARKDHYQLITDQVIALMEEHGSDWTNPMVSGTAGGWPVNPVTGKRYNGINVALLLMAGGGHWATYKQWATKGCQVRKGEKATGIVFFKRIEVKDKIDPTKTDTIPMLRGYSVFRADQVDGEFAEQFNAPAEDRRDETVQIDAVNDWVAATGADIRTVDGGRAFYSPGTDSIQMPPRSGFDATATSTATETYHNTLLHELAHWTGHKSRLDRLGKASRFGDTAYAREELVAELAAAYQCVELGVSSAPRPDHAKYLNGWLAALKNDKRLIVKAASRAQAAVDYIADLQDAQIEEAA